VVSFSSGCKDVAASVAYLETRGMFVFLRRGGIGLGLRMGMRGGLGYKRMISSHGVEILGGSVH